MQWSRVSLATALYALGPRPESQVRQVAAKNGIPFVEMVRAAQSLGVEFYREGGKRYWRLPANVIPFAPRQRVRLLERAAVLGGSAA